MIRTYKVAIIEDEAILRQHLKSILLTRYDDIEVIGEAENVAQALALFDAHPEIECVFMDIRLEMDSSRAGVDLAIKLNQRNNALWFIFSTAFINYAAEILNNGIKSKVIHYLTKPIDTNELDNALERLRKEIINQGNTDENEVKEIHFEITHKVIRTEKEITKKEKVTECIKRNDIVYVRRNQQSKTVHIKLTNNRLLNEIHGSLVDWQEKLNCSYFQSIHRSHFINIHHVQSIHPHPFQKETYQVSFKCCSDRLTIGETFYKVLKKKLNAK